MPVAKATREAIYSALFAVLQSSLPQLGVPITTFSRRFIDWSSVPSSDQPALIMLEGEERAERRVTGLLRWRLGALVLYYFIGPGQGGQQDPPPVTQANDIIDAIETAIMSMDENGNPFSAGPQTLGGLVTDTFIEGTIAFEQVGFDVPGGQGLITVPVVMELWI